MKKVFLFLVLGFSSLFAYDFSDLKKVSKELGKNIEVEIKHVGENVKLKVYHKGRPSCWETISERPVSAIVAALTVPPALIFGGIALAAIISSNAAGINALGNLVVCGMSSIVLIPTGIPAIISMYRLISYRLSRVEELLARMDSNELMFAKGKHELSWKGLDSVFFDGNTGNLIFDYSGEKITVSRKEMMLELRKFKELIDTYRSDVLLQAA